MKRTKEKRQCGNCYFTRLIEGVLHCIKDPPAIDLDTGAAKWPTVEQEGKCGCFCDIYDDVCRGRPLCNPRIYIDRFGKYCKIPLTQGQFAKVDPEDFLWLSQNKWYCTAKPTSCYVARKRPLSKKQRQIWMHREIMKTPKHLVCDHINRNALDNRKKNLRNCTTRENLLNRGPQRNSTSRYKGVHWHKKAKKWVARIRNAGICEHLGGFESEIAAAKAYDKAAKQLLDVEFAYLNFPDQ